MQTSAVQNTCATLHRILAAPASRYRHGNSDIPGQGPHFDFLLNPRNVQNAHDCPTIVMFGDLCAVIALAFLEPLALVCFFQLIGA